MSLRQPLLLALIVLAGCSTPESEGKEIESLNFEDASPGSLPTSLTAFTGDWKVVVDTTAPSADHALAQSATSESRDFNVVLLENTRIQAVDLSVSFKSIAGVIDQGGGPIWRAKDARNYYIARYNPLEDNYRVYTVVEGKRHQLMSANIPHSPGWHTLRITMTGSTIQCFYDGEAHLELEDSTFTEAGKVGLWTKADAQTHFDDVKVR